MYDEAFAHSKAMSDQSDTDHSDFMPPPTMTTLPAKRKTVNRATIARTPAADFNDVVSYFIFEIIVKFIDFRRFISANNV